MRPVLSFVALAATVLLHAALIAAVIIGMPGKQKSTTPPPLTVQIVPTPAAATAAPSPAESPSPDTQPAETKPPTNRPPVKKKPRLRPHPSNTQRTPPPTITAETKPELAPTPSASAPASAESSLPTPSTQPTPPPSSRTSASVATYAASNRKPPYPRLSRINDEQGTVVLRVLVKADGTAGAVEIKTSSGYRLLDESARSTVQTWRFNPATVNGKPLDEWYELAIPFKLQNN